ncbi:MAG: hypothetical protein M0Z52_07405 [Actinomycetota bacterium]|nr:hypothetical protein [Actinomycetota bacterium]
MTPDQIKKAIALGNCTFQVGSYNKRFCSNMLSVALNKPDMELTEKQAANLERMFHMYRRQIKDHEKICSICGPAWPAGTKGREAEKESGKTGTAGKGGNPPADGKAGINGHGDNGQSYLPGIESARIYGPE